MNTQVTQKTRDELIEDRIDKDFARNIGISSIGSFVPTTLGEAMEFAKMMAVSGPMVGKSFRGQPGACLGIAMQAWRWGMDPYAVSQKAYTANDNIAYEAQLVAAVINIRAPIEGRPTYAYEGDGDKLICTVSVKLTGDDEPKVLVSPPFGSITPKNSPLWKTNPRQQLAYHTIRNWARLYVPEIIMGVYDSEEVEEIARAERARDVTPAKTATSALDAFASEEQHAYRPTLDRIAELEKLIKEAPDARTLSSIWQEVQEASEIRALRRAFPAETGRLCEIYNATHQAFTDELEKSTQANTAGGTGDPEREPGPDDEGEAERRDKSHGQTNDAANSDEMTEEEIDAANSYTGNAVGKIQSFKNAKPLINWFNTEFKADAAKHRLSQGQIENVARARDEKIKTFR